MNTKPAVWIDFENAPHVWVLSPVIEHLRANGYPLILTARDFSYTVGLCRRLGYDAEIVGPAGPGTSTLAKAWRILGRAVQMFVRLRGARRGIALALSHGSRSQIVAAHHLGIPVVSLDDYEYSDQSLVRFVDHLLVPFPIPKDVWGRRADRVRHYPGLKEELYLCSFVAAASRVKELDGTDRVKVLFRPEGRSAHYHSAQSEVLQRAILEYVTGQPGAAAGVFLVLLPRDAAQAKELVSLCEQRGIPHWLPREVLDGPALISSVDLVLSGGGTMTREAAVMGVPSYSFFSGQWGAVDRYLRAQGRLVQLADEADVARIALGRRDGAHTVVSDDALRFVTGFVTDLLCNP